MPDRRIVITPKMFKRALKTVRVTKPKRDKNPAWPPPLKPPPGKPE
jgi:hypothetical protein